MSTLTSGSWIAWLMVSLDLIWRLVPSREYSLIDRRASGTMNSTFCDPTAIVTTLEKSGRLKLLSV